MLTVNTSQFVRLKSTEGSVLKSRRWRCWCVPRHSYMSWASRGDIYRSCGLNMRCGTAGSSVHSFVVIYSCILWAWLMSITLFATTYVLTWTTWQTVTSRVSTERPLSTRCILGAGTSFDTAAEIEDRRAAALIKHATLRHVLQTSQGSYSRHFIQLKLSAVYCMKVFRCDVDLELQDFMRESWYE